MQALKWGKSALRSARRRPVRALRAVLIAGALALAASSCTTNDPSLQLAMPGSAPPAAMTIPSIMADAASEHAAGGSNPGAATPTRPGASAETSAAAAEAAAGASDPDDLPLPDVVAYVPTPNPRNPFAAALPALQAAPTGNGVPTGQTALSETAMTPEAGPTTGGRPSEPAHATAVGAAPQASKHHGFLAFLFSPPPDGHMTANAAPHAQPVVVAALDTVAAKPLIDAAAPARPVVDLSSAATPGAPHHYASGGEMPPGVRSGASLFEIRRKSDVGDNSDVDINEQDGDPVEVASAGGMARLDPHGLILQRGTVDTACLRPALLSVLKKIEQHYGRKLIVTSGYRSPVHNVAARGAHNSLHMFCAAADVQMPGVSKWELAAYARSMPGRGGVGTYCYTKSVHIDIGPERDWNWRCRRKRHRR
jgi:uncharacterized protein YcbK (DUF882 family)